MTVEVEEREARAPTKEGAGQRVHALARAMIDGASKRGQCQGHFFSEERSCALGAAYEGVTGRTSVASTLDVITVLRERTGVDLLARVPAEVFGEIPLPPHNYKLIDAIVMLNDRLHWSRGRIAEWLYSLEEYL